MASMRNELCLDLQRFRGVQGSYLSARFDVGVSSIDGELIAAWGKKAGGRVMLGARSPGGRVCS